MFENITFHGQFRTYQQKILDEAERYLKDGRIHIIAAPGSGKTILGLELILRLRSPCLILSPTTTIRNQWGERFETHFLSGGEAEQYVSYDLKHFQPLTSVTYQALHAAMRQKRDAEGDADFFDYDLLAEVKRYGIRTICLDEAHHLQNEWQKALEEFLAALDGQVTVIALTATPPYDAQPAEWNRYISVCGEIDEEIFVPELVKENTLCPHQDFLYFNFPTAAESADFKAYRTRAEEALAEIPTDSVKRAYDRLMERKTDYDFLFDNTKEIVALLSLCEYRGISVDRKLVSDLTGVKHLPRLTMERATIAVNFLLHEILDEKDRVAIAEICKRHGIFERGEVSFGLNERLRRELISSVGKLKSIAEIAKSEYDDRGKSLRLLVLTDYIKRERLGLIGSDEEADEVSVVSVFETLRRTGITVGALSGSLVILPSGCAQSLQNLGADFAVKHLPNTAYSVYEFRADNREKVRLVGILFERGELNALVGTKSLLGEGWDAPCVNSLILASFVGSYMLSNQMRGRAIRTDRNQPEKTANIWHLVTIERPALYAEKTKEKLERRLEEDPNRLISYDFETVSRRFDCFVAPNYETGEIESGIDRVTVLRPPYDEKGIGRINREMTVRAREHGRLREAWKSATNGSAKLNEGSEVPKQDRKPPFLFVNIGYACLLSALLLSGSGAFISSFVNSFLAQSVLKYPIMILSLLVCISALSFLVRLLETKILAHLNPERSVRTLANCVLNAMKEVGLISEGARVRTQSDTLGIWIRTELLNASVHDQNLFHSAVEQMLSPITNPRYLLIPRGKLGGDCYRYALACPEALGAKASYAECLAKHLRRSLGRIQVVYTRNEDGRKLILKCRAASYITYNEQTLARRKKKVSRWE